MKKISVTEKMATIPNTGMPFDVHQVMQASMYRPPIDQYPNSENIKPPIKKEPIRVIEQMDRSSVKYDSTEDFYAKLEVIKQQMKNAEFIKYKRDASVTTTKMDQGKIVNIVA